MKRKSLLKKFISPVLVPATKRYLQKERIATFFGMRLSIPTGVFHPSLFFSTKTMGQWLLQQELNKTELLEIGCGSGAISILAAKQGAKVTCFDINPEAVKTTLKNAEKNRVDLHCFLSDLFTNIEKKKFNLILNNPPYYPKDPATMEENAWYAGKNMEYFEKLFQRSKEYLSPDGQILLVLSDECNTTLINEIAAKEGYDNRIVYSRANFMEKTFIIQYKFMDNM
jgi:release factor glutamine methyltransferase